MQRGRASRLKQSGDLPLLFSFTGLTLGYDLLGLNHNRGQKIQVRLRHDKSGWEPRRLFNVVEFMMHDKDMSGTIDMDECMEILFRRFGKEQLEAKVAEFMQNDEDGDNDISFTEFLEMDHREHYKNRGPGEGGALKASKSSTQVR